MILILPPIEDEERNLSFLSQLSLIMEEDVPLSYAFWLEKEKRSTRSIRERERGTITKERSSPFAGLSWIPAGRSWSAHGSITYGDLWISYREAVERFEERVRSYPVDSFPSLRCIDLPFVCAIKPFIPIYPSSSSGWEGRVVRRADKESVIMVWEHSKRGEIHIQRYSMDGLLITSHQGPLSLGEGKMMISNLVDGYLMLAESYRLVLLQLKEGEVKMKWEWEREEERIGGWEDESHLLMYLHTYRDTLLAIYLPKQKDQLDGRVELLRVTVGEDLKIIKRREVTWSSDPMQRSTQVTHSPDLSTVTVCRTIIK